MNCYQVTAQTSVWANSPSEAAHALGFDQGNPNTVVTVKDALTPRLQRVAEGVHQGLGNKAIGEQLGLTEGTVKMYLRDIYRRLKVNSRLQLGLMMERMDGEPTRVSGAAGGSGPG